MTASSEPGNAWETMVWRKKEMRSHNVLLTCRELNCIYSSKCRAVHVLQTQGNNKLMTGADYEKEEAKVQQRTPR